MRHCGSVGVEVGSILLGCGNFLDSYHQCEVGHYSEASEVKMAHWLSWSLCMSVVEFQRSYVSLPWGWQPPITTLTCHPPHLGRITYNNNSSLHRTWAPVTINTGCAVCTLYVSVSSGCMFVSVGSSFCTTEFKRIRAQRKPFQVWQELSPVRGDSRFFALSFSCGWDFWTVVMSVCFVIVKSFDSTLFIGDILWATFQSRITCVK